MTPLSSTKCNCLVHILSTSGAIAICFGTFLFLAWVRGVFSHSKRAKVLFTILWVLAILGVLSVILFSFSGTSVPPKGTYAISCVGKFEVVGSFTVTVFDLAVFLSISYPQYLLAELHTVVRPTFRSFSVMQVIRRLRPHWYGQDNSTTCGFLYLQSMTICWYHFCSHSPMFILLLCLLVFEFLPIPPVEVLSQCRATIYLAHAVFYNIMACRVFRLLRLVVSLEGCPNMRMSDLESRPNSMLEDVA